MCIRDSSWIHQGKTTTFCTCFMNSGYSAGWCQESFGIPLISREILCRAKGDPFCRFVMAQRHKLDHFIPVSYTHLRAHETVLDLVCRLLLEKKKNNKQHTHTHKKKKKNRQKKSRKSPKTHNKQNVNTCT